MHGLLVDTMRRGASACPGAPAAGCGIPASGAALASRPTRLWRAAAFAALLAALWQFGQAGYIHAKAWLSQVLIRDAWARTLGGQRAAKPWPWADTWPVARLSVPRLGVQRYVLAGADGRTIAFGPGHVFGTPLPGEAGNSVVGGHRDTHFAFLRDLAPGDEIRVETTLGRAVLYTVVATAVTDKDDTGAVRPTERTQLTLVTCYPFDALRAGGPLRYLVVAVAVGIGDIQNRGGEAMVRGMSLLEPCASCASAEKRQPQLPFPV